MNHEDKDDVHLRKYLLGELNEAEQQALEERLLTEHELFDLLPVVEDELIDDYLGGELSTDERGSFERFFTSIPERQRKLSFAMAFNRYVTANITTEPQLAEARSVASLPFWSRAYASPYVRMAAAAVI